MEKIPMIFEDERPIKAIIYNDDEGSSIWAGYGDVAKMIGYAENGECAHVPFIACFDKDGNIIRRVPAFKLQILYFHEATKDILEGE